MCANWIAQIGVVPRNASTLRCDAAASTTPCPGLMHLPRAARQLDTLLKELCVPLGRYVREFPPPARLHPFERALLDLTVGPGTYERVLARVDALRRSTVQVGGSPGLGDDCGAVF